MEIQVCRDDSVSRRILTHLERLEAESIHIFREVVAEQAGELIVRHLVP